MPKIRTNQIESPLVTPALGTPASGVLTNCTGTATGLTAGAANGIKSATTTVSTSAATAPSSGQVLTATSSSTATWQTPNPVFRKYYNRSTASQGAGFSTDTYVIGSDVSINNGTLKAGTIYKTWFRVTKTAAGTATPIINVRFGTNGSTSDASLATFTFTAGTAAIDDGIFEVWVTFTTVGSGSSATVLATARCTHKLSVTGITGTAAVSETEHVISAGFDSTISNARMGVSLNAGTSAAWTVHHAWAEMENLN